MVFSLFWDTVSIAIISPQGIYEEHPQVPKTKSNILYLCGYGEESIIIIYDYLCFINKVNLNTVSSLYNHIKVNFFCFMQSVEILKLNYAIGF